MFSRTLTSFFSRLTQVDRVLVSLALILWCVGIVNMYSNDAGGEIFFRHIINVVISLGVVVVVAQTPFRILLSLAPFIYGLSVLALILVLLIGENIKGGQRWLEFFDLRIQPSEHAKVACILAMTWLILHRPLGPSLSLSLLLCVVVAIPCVLIFQQPDLGTALIFIALGLAFLFLAGIHKRLIFIGLLAACISAPLVWNNLHDYQKDRILSFSGLSQDLRGSGYHAFQSKISIGSGGLYGKGWGNSTQSRLDFLPEHSTDFGFAVFAEEFGFFGSVLLLMLFLGLFWRIFNLAQHAEDNAVRVLVGASGVFLFIHLCVNIGMVMGLLPVVGAPLPFISYGGSAATATALLLGIVLSATRSNANNTYAKT